MVLKLKMEYLVSSAVCSVVKKSKFFTISSYRMEGADILINLGS